MTQIHIALYSFFFSQNDFYNSVLGCLILFKWVSKVIFNQKLEVIHLSLVLVNVNDKIIVV